MSEREEIHWKFQIFLDTIDTSTQLHENERVGFQSYLEKYAQEKKEIRNTLLGMIAFGIGLIISLISIKIVEEDLAWLIIPSLIGAGAVYLKINIKIYLTALKVHNLDIKYLRIKKDLITFKGLIIGLALKDEIPEEEVHRLIEYSFVLTQIFAYEIGYFAHNIMKYPKPIQDQYRESYNVIKQNLDQIKSIGLEEHKNRFDLFLKEFEKNEGKFTHLGLK